MTFVAEANWIPILIAVLIGLAVGWWAFRRIRAGKSEDADSPLPAPPPPPARAAQRDGREGNRLQDEVAAATADVAGEILGVEAHPLAPDAHGPPDNLQMLKGVGPRLAALLAQYGITRFDQLAGLGKTEIALLDARLGAFAGRIERDRLVEQACYLARDDRDGFEAKFGKLGGG
jgi:predicted flap endonuclease-1-like 5' DNA nuclease